MNIEKFTKKDKDSFLKIILEFRTLDDVRNICGSDIEMSKFCNLNKIYISYKILKKYFPIVPFKDKRVLSAIKQFHKLNYVKKIYDVMILNDIINNGYLELLEILCINKYIYFSAYWRYIKSPNALLNIIQLIDTYNKYYIDIIVDKNWQVELRDDIKQYMLNRN